MSGKARFGLSDGIALIVTSSVFSIFLTSPLRVLAEIAGPAAWISVLVGFSLILVQVYLLYRLLKKYPGSNLIEITGLVLGKYAGVAVNILLVSFFVYVVAVINRNFAELLLSSSLPSTPVSIVFTGYVLIGIMGAYAGIEAIARSARVTLSFVLSGIALLLLALIPEWDFTNLFPLLGNGPYRVFADAGFSMAGTSEILVGAVILKVLYDHELYRRIMYRSFFITYVLILAVVLTLLMVFGHSAAQEMTMPFYGLASLISLGRFFQRLESVYIIIWTFVGMFKSALTLYAAAFSLAGALRLPDYRPLIWPLALICFVLTIVPPDFPEAIRSLNAVVLGIDHIFIFGIPLILLAVGWLRDRQARPGR